LRGLRCEPVRLGHKLAGANKRRPKNIRDISGVMIARLRRVLYTYVDVLHDVHLADILTQTTNADSVASVADQVLHDDIGAVWFEGNAVIAVVDVGVLNHDVVRAVGVPARIMLSIIVRKSPMAWNQLTHQCSSPDSCSGFLQQC
jgi:hypothetical protein